MEQLDIIVLAVVAVGITLLIVWALLGPRRQSDESGHHVDLAEETRRRDVERAAGRDPDRDAGEDD